MEDGTDGGADQAGSHSEPPADGLSDDELNALYAQGPRAPGAWERMFCALEGTLKRVARKILADERAVEDAYSHGRERTVRSWLDGHEVESIRLWLRRVVRNGALDILRKSAHWQTFQETKQAESRAQSPSTNPYLQELINREGRQRAREQLDGAIKKLRTDNERGVIRLYYLDGRTDREIATLLRLGVRRVKTIRYGAIAHLRADLNPSSPGRCSSPGCPANGDQVWQRTLDLGWWCEEHYRTAKLANGACCAGGCGKKWQTKRTPVVFFEERGGYCIECCSCACGSCRGRCGKPFDKRLRPAYVRRTGDTLHGWCKACAPDDGA